VNKQRFDVIGAIVRPGANTDWSFDVVLMGSLNLWLSNNPSRRIVHFQVIENDGNKARVLVLSEEA